MPIAGRARGQLASPLVGGTGRSIPVYAFALETGLRVVLASIWRPNVPGAVSFVEEHDLPGVGGKHVHGLSAGDHVIVVEDK